MTNDGMTNASAVRFVIRHSSFAGTPHFTTDEALAGRVRGDGTEHSFASCAARRGFFPPSPSSARQLRHGSPLAAQLAKLCPPARARSALLPKSDDAPPVTPLVAGAFTARFA